MNFKFFLEVEVTSILDLIPLTNVVGVTRTLETCNRLFWAQINLYLKLEKQKFKVQRK